MLKNILALKKFRCRNTNSNSLYNLEKKYFVDFKKMVVMTRKVRKAKTTFMKYPCIPVWMKEREKDHFDYPLRSRKEIVFEQYMQPPLFTAKVITNQYRAITDSATLAVHKADNRNNEVTLQLNIKEMMLTPLQKKRLIFLLGNRWRNDGIVKIVSKNYTNLDHNLAKAFDILRQLYWEAKRAPMYIWSKMKNSERRRAAIKIFGKVSTEEREKLKKLSEEEVLRQKEKFDQVYDNGNYTTKFIMDNIKNHVERAYQTSGETEKAEEERMKETTRKIEETLSKENLDKQLVKKRILTKKAYETFYANTLDEEEQQN